MKYPPLDGCFLSLHGTISVEGEGIFHRFPHGRWIILHIAQQLSPNRVQKNEKTVYYITSVKENGIFRLTERENCASIIRIIR